jgi:hypothetical protein
MINLSKPRAHRNPWTPHAEEELRRLAAQGQFLPEIAATLGRSQEAVRTRANLLGVSVRFAAERRPRNGHVGEGEPIVMAPEARQTS